MTMRERITDEVSRRLERAADGELKREIVEELSGNLYAKYEDLTAAGLDPEEAYGQAMDSLGDVSELIELAGGSKTRAEFERAVDSVMSVVRDVAQELKEPLKDMVDDICHVAHAAKEPLKDVGRAIAGAVRDLSAPAQDADAEPVDGEPAEGETAEAPEDPGDGEAN